MCCESEPSSRGVRTIHRLHIYERFISLSQKPCRVLILGLLMAQTLMKFYITGCLNVPDYSARKTDWLRGSECLVSKTVVFASIESCRTLGHLVNQSEGRLPVNDMLPPPPCPPQKIKSFLQFVDNHHCHNQRMPPHNYYICFRPDVIQSLTLYINI